MPTAEPPPRLWPELGLRARSELHAGHQSRVFLADRGDETVVVKLVEPGADDQADDQAGDRRVELNRRLAERDSSIVGPLDLGDGPIRRLDGWRITCFPLVEGDPPDPDDPGAVEAMATTLAGLHRSLRHLDGVDLPPVAALRAIDSPAAAQGYDQLIHGDYDPANLISTAEGLRVIDFDDAGWGTVEFELGNSLYMNRFDAWRADRPERVSRFRARFLEAYRDAASTPIDETLVDEAIATRTAALARWLGRPEQAPIGIRTASPAWRRRLRSFLDQHPA